MRSGVKQSPLQLKYAYVITETGAKMKKIFSALIVMTALTSPMAAASMAWADGDEPFTPTNMNPHAGEDDPYHTGDTILVHFISAVDRDALAAKAKQQEDKQQKTVQPSPQ